MLKSLHTRFFIRVTCGQEVKFLSIYLAWRIIQRHSTICCFVLFKCIDWWICNLKEHVTIWNSPIMTFNFQYLFSSINCFTSTMANCHSHMWRRVRKDSCKYNFRFQRRKYDLGLMQAGSTELIWYTVTDIDNLSIIYFIYKKVCFSNIVYLPSYVTGTLFTLNLDRIPSMAFCAFLNWDRE